MYKVYDTSQPEGFPIELDNFLAFQQSGYNAPMEAIGKAFGNMVIIDGVTESGNPLVIVAPGFGIVNNELVYFEGGAKQATFYLTTDTATLIYQGNVAKPVLQTRIARFGNAATLQFNYADLRRVQSTNTGLIDRIMKIEKMLAPLLGYTDPTNPLNTVYGSWLFWGRPAGEIPAGWEPVPDVDWKGKVPVVLNTADPDFETVGQTGGSKTATITQDELPNVQINVPILKADTSVRADGSGFLVLGDQGAGQEATDGPTLQTASLGAGNGHPNIQPYKVVMFIRFSG